MADLPPPWSPSLRSNRTFNIQHLERITHSCSNCDCYLSLISYTGKVFRSPLLILTAFLSVYIILLIPQGPFTLDGHGEWTRGRVPGCIRDGYVDHGRVVVREFISGSQRVIGHGRRRVIIVRHSWRKGDRGCRWHNVGWTDHIWRLFVWWIEVLSRLSNNTLKCFGAFSFKEGQYFRIFFFFFLLESLSE